MKYNNSLRSIYIPLIVAVSLSAGILAGFFLPGRNGDISHAGIRTKPDKITMMLNIIRSNYVDTVDLNTLEESAISAVLKKLDPHSVYIRAKDLKRANEPLQGNFDGIGITFNLLTDTILVISTIPNGPSEKAGLLAGDKIIYVNDSLVAGKGITDEEAMGMLKGPRGTIVKLKILRKGSPGLLSFDITRGKIPIHTVDVAYMVNETTGYIKINNFALTTYDEFVTSLKELLAKGMKKLIIDLRNNPGGVMEAAIQIANQFLAKDELIVYTQGRAFPKSEARATGNGLFPEGDLVLLIDEYTASASEILAGAIQDNDRGTIIGRRSFGKGLVQEPVMFPDGSGMRLTVARYYTPSGRSIQKPYDKGSEKYYEDFYDQFERGEQFSPDTAGEDILPVFKSKGGKTLYGGGGIVPDIFVPADTSEISRYFLLVRNSLIYRFALNYTEANREKLSIFTDVAELEKYLDRQNLTEQFIQFASENGIKRDEAGIRTSGRIIGIQLKAYIARNTLDNKGFYPIWEKLDTTLKYAIGFLGGKQATVK
ncbi:MAG TPA: S41 family peptidase [Bacteroidales bacterium]|nr:S41 family peptidase [Bacteroidales bacterium]HRT90636.1 S41 family peptidase [Bacteroidales bacterium]